MLARSLEGKQRLERVAVVEGNDIGPAGLAALKAALRAAGKLDVLR